ncbi:hypothetical protein D3C78_1205180 [compost metagenome]
MGKQTGDHQRAAGGTARQAPDFLRIEPAQGQAGQVLAEAIMQSGQHNQREGKALHRLLVMGKAGQHGHRRQAGQPNRRRG